MINIHHQLTCLSASFTTRSSTSANTHIQQMNISDSDDMEVDSTITDTATAINNNNTTKSTTLPSQHQRPVIINSSNSTTNATSSSSSNSTISTSSNSNSILPFHYCSHRSVPGAGLYQPLDEVRLVLQVHDELVFEVRQDLLDVVCVYFD